MRGIRTVFLSLEIRPFAPLLAFGHTASRVESRMGSCLFPLPSESNLRHFPASPTYVFVGEGSIFLFPRTCVVMLCKNGPSSYFQVARRNPARFTARVHQCPCFRLIFLTLFYRRLLNDSWFSNVFVSGEKYSQGPKNNLMDVIDISNGTAFREFAIALDFGRVDAQQVCNKVFTWGALLSTNIQTWRPRCFKKNRTMQQDPQQKKISCNEAFHVRWKTVTLRTLCGSHLSLRWPEMRGKVHFRGLPCTWPPHIQQGLWVPLSTAFSLTCLFVLAGRMLFLLAFMSNLTHPSSVWIGLSIALRWDCIRNGHGERRWVDFWYSMTSILPQI